MKLINAILQNEDQSSMLGVIMFRCKTRRSCIHKG